MELPFYLILVSILSGLYVGFPVMFRSHKSLTAVTLSDGIIEHHYRTSHHSCSSGGFHCSAAKYADPPNNTLGKNLTKSKALRN